MANLRLTLACGPYDRTQAIIDGVVRAEGIDLTYLALQPAEIFWRQLQYREFDVSEMSMSNYTTTVAQALARNATPPFIAIPVFPSRVFRHGYFFYNPDKFKGGIKSPREFEGRRGGVPEYSMTAAVYMRGLLQHDYGVDLSKLSWLQGRTSRIQHDRSATMHGLDQAAPNDLGKNRLGSFRGLGLSPHRGRPCGPRRCWQGRVLRLRG